MRFLRTAAVLAVGLVLGASAVVIGGDTPQRYTGCLTRDGTLYRVAVGDSPVKACAKTETQITWNQQGPQGEAGPSGAPGAKGDQGDPGPADLDALAGSACTVGGRAGTLSYAVDSATGAVTLTCVWNAHTISVAVTNGVLSNIDIRFPASDGTICSDAAACSFTYDTGASYSAVLLTNGSAFRYDCGDGVMQQATVNLGVWSGRCGGTGVAGWSPFTSDHAVAVDLTYRVTANVIDDVFDFWIQDLTNHTYPALCDHVTTCAADVPAGHSVVVWLYAPAYMSVTCPGQPARWAEWTATCSTTSLSSDYTVNAIGY